MHRRSGVSGFTLIEILVVLSLLGVLFGLSIGFVARAGKGNLLMQTANSLISQLATARAQSSGNDTAYVKLETNADGEVRIRSFRNRQVLHWACEDFVRASEEDVLNRQGSVDMAPADAVPSGEGRHVKFAGGRVEVKAMADLAFVDGFQFKCRLNPDKNSGANSALFQKGINHITVSLMGSEPGRYDIEATIKLAPDLNGEGGGEYRLRTGFRGAEDVAEWHAPVVAGRWQNVSISYDRNAFSIYVNDRLRALRTDRKNAMRPETESPLVIGAGYMGGFDSLLIAGIFEDGEDLYRVPPQVIWIDAEGKPIQEQLSIHFRNRALDPGRHPAPLDVIFKLNDETGARRAVQITLSGEAFTKKVGE